MSCREIKFRVWFPHDEDDKAHQRINGLQETEGFYIYPKYETFNRAAGFVAHEDLIGQAAIQDGSKKLVWEQYIGLKDKNGVDIYEGCFLEIIPFGEECDKYTTLVDWKGEIKVYGFEYDTTLLEWADHIVRSNIEVIGNIHENPELLEQK